jgi:hypothetical protein
MIFKTSMTTPSSPAVVGAAAGGSAVPSSDSDQYLLFKLLQ